MLVHDVPLRTLLAKNCRRCRLQITPSTRQDDIVCNFNISPRPWSAFECPESKPPCYFYASTNLLISESSYYCWSTRVVIIIVEPASRDPGEGRRFSKIFSLLYTLVARKPLYFRSLLSQCSLEPPTTCPPQRSSSGAEARRGAFTPAVCGRASGRRAT